ncbi:lysophospholipid acyltransferase family protein [Aliiroseovarius crassostreae]|uniref:1-acyl-sn-glycerol-3-phosphate acyltransferase n=1 Tax=Aliiroseovarius crassostreae TaxID=154981 RepID=A0A9Q9HG38_9RHOB|nr:lysophospholipid acyltransferase family protein [Aliiroseovarius crassostreae]UWP90231.1 1-acyl-sn-glycerol-3-phosphate acyltransferase [Aliiroseovarius crassostreae]UWP96562.1 1-acyl-sn-glycerol-3-phosphate acyltransferase [Aliiroseovarius crassostreae]UWQ02881.1 1-acyl-sn-glycerol-3-phosphate acyltransferase [Aliiroseovarius crassostreae]
MTALWRGEEEPGAFRPGWAGGIRAVLRGVPLAILVFGGLLVLLLVRLIERPLFGLNRPITPFITQFVCRSAFFVLGIPFSARGGQMREKGAVVANHGGWLDIFALNAKKRVYFVSKAEVASWPGIGWLARATGTVFIKRDRKEATSQIGIFRDRLSAGHKLLFFPEGTSSDARRVLPFKSTLFAAFFAPELRSFMWVQPVTVRYFAPEGEDPRFYGWWGDMAFAPHLLQTLAARRQGRVEVVYHKPVKVTDFANRKALAAHCEHEVRNGLGELDVETTDPEVLADLGSVHQP